VLAGVLVLEERLGLHLEQGMIGQWVVADGLIERSGRRYRLPR